MANQGSNQETSTSLASVEGVPSRSGVGKEEGHSVNPLNDEGTEKRRARFGEKPEFNALGGDFPVSDVNDVKTIRNKTMVEQIRLNGIDTSYGRAMCA